MNGTGWKKRIMDWIGWNDPLSGKGRQKLPRKQQLLLVLLFGLLLIVIAMPAGEKEGADDQEKKPPKENVILFPGTEADQHTGQ